MRLGSLGAGTISVEAVIEFGRFLGFRWGDNLAALKKELLSCGVRVRSRGLEFKSVKNVDADMFVEFGMAKIEASPLEYGDLLELMEGFLGWRALGNGEQQESLEGAAKALGLSERVRKDSKG